MTKPHDGLTIGDELIVNSHHGSVQNVGRITKLTPTRITVAIGQREVAFVRKTMREVGFSGTYGGSVLFRATKDELTKVRHAVVHKHLARQLQDVAWATLPTQVLRDILTMVKAYATP
jgi:hypothetical protein